MDRKTCFLLSMFIVMLVLANILGSKFIEIFSLPVSVGIFAYAVTFLITDIVEEVHGKKVVKDFITFGLIAMIVSLVYVFVAIALEPADFYKNNSAYVTVFSNSARVIIASIVAFLISQTHDVWMFNFVKKRTKGKFLWLRNNISTIFSQLFDTIIFTFIAFYNPVSGYGLSRMISMIVPYWILKVLFALMDTPFVYLGVKWMKKNV
ncbi:queuosine precursor transporter [Candidatus Woesearchaeota archaeon]|nr:queuosine precursor transporter [Candidatus Woesearchaeota archaeon]